MLRKFMATAAAGLLLAAPAVADIYVVTDDDAGKPMTEQMPDPDLAKVPEINGAANDGFTYAQRWTGLDGFQVFEGRVAPGGSIASHDGPDTYILYVVQGTGKLVMTGPDDEEISRVTYKPNDVIVFGPGTMHNWINSDQEFVFIGVQKPNQSR